MTYNPLKMVHPLPPDIEPIRPPEPDENSSIINPQQAPGKNNLLYYPESDDIYNKGVENKDADPEMPSQKKTLNEEIGIENEKDFDHDPTGDDLDVPGGELDDADEAIGNEDEENNYYSLGGDNHNNLDEGFES